MLKESDRVALNESGLPELKEGNLPALKGKYAREVLEYAGGIADGGIIAGEDRMRAGQRFLDMISSGQYEIRTRDADFVIGIIENTFKHRQGEAIDGTPMRGKPFLLEPWEKFCVYGMLCFYYPGTQERVVKEAFIFVPRKNSKTLFVSALAWGLGLLERASGAKVYVVAMVLKQAMETFDNWDYNLTNSWYDSLNEAKADGWRYLNNNMEHSISHNNFDGGSVHMEALAGNAGAHDSFNCNVVIADEVHAYKSPEEYNRLKEATKAYTNKLVIGISTAGDDAAGFCAKHLEYCQSVVRGQVRDESLFAFLCMADRSEDGDVDYLDPIQHQKANPNYGVTIRPKEMEREALLSQNNPIMRKDFITRSLNVFVSSMRAYFNLAEFQNSNREAGEVLGIPPNPPYLAGEKALKAWREQALKRLKELNINWYGGTDLSKMHDLTAAALYGEYKDIDIVITHEWFPIVAATQKADEDKIPLFGWQDEGHLTMTNAPTTNHADVVKWYKDMRKRGFKIRQIGHDRKFNREYFIGMKRAGFTVVDQPQYHYKKNEGFRRIEVKAKNKKFYYLGSTAFEYCVGNVRAIEKTDDAVEYKKADEHLRIDVFDCAVFGAIRMLEDKEKSQSARKWLDE